MKNLAHFPVMNPHTRIYFSDAVLFFERNQYHTFQEATRLIYAFIFLWLFQKLK